jgi:import inner membrane translocase subunit TIM13
MSLWGSSSSSSTDATSKKQQVMDQVRAELAMANAQELISKLGDKCYEKCIPNPGADLSSTDKTCLSKCMDRYMEAWNLVSEVYFHRVQKESQH